jgi:hypothetical protein
MLLITDEDALASVEAVEAAYRALRQNRWTPGGRSLSATEEVGAGATS